MLSTTCNGPVGLYSLCQIGSIVVDYHPGLLVDGDGVRQLPPPSPSALHDFSSSGSERLGTLSHSSLHSYWSGFRDHTLLSAILLERSPSLEDFLPLLESPLQSVPLLLS